MCRIPVVKKGSQNDCVARSLINKHMLTTEVLSLNMTSWTGKSMKCQFVR